MLKKSTLLSVSIFFVLFIGVSDYGYGCHKMVDGDPAPHGNRGPCDPPDGGGDGGGNVPVMVTFRDDPAHRIQGDGLVYIDRMDKVSTGIGSPNSFFMKLTKGNQPGIRTLFLDFNDCASGPCDAPFLQGSFFVPTNVFARGVDLRGMGLFSSSDLRLKVELNLFSEGFGLLSLFFDPENMEDCEGSDKIQVTRTSSITWVIEAEQDDIACVTGFDGSDNNFLGLYHMPFLITVELK